MKSVRDLLLGTILGAALVGCAGWAYQYYGLSLPDACYDQGTLLGKTPKDDIPFASCKPDQQVKGKCAIYLVAEHERLMTDLNRCQVDLKSCQQGQ